MNGKSQFKPCWRPLVLGALVILIMGLLTYFGFSLRAIRHSLQEEVRTTEETTELLKRTVSLLTQDSEDLRDALGLPIRIYPPLDEEEHSETEGRWDEQGGQYLQFYRAVENLLSHSLNLEREKRFVEIFEAPEIANLLRANGLRLNKTADAIILEKNGSLYHSFRWESQGASYEIRTYTGESLHFDRASEELASFIQNETRRLDSHFSLLQQKTRALQEFLASPRTRERIVSQGFVLEAPKRSRDFLIYPITMKVQRDVDKLRVGLDRKTGLFFIGSQSLEDPAELDSAFFTALAAVDPRTVEELKVEEVAREILELAEDESFRAYLKSKNLSLSTLPREDTDYLYFDFLSPLGEKQGALGIQKKVQGDIYLFDTDDISLGALRTFRWAEEWKKKSDLPRLNPAIPSQASASSRHFLVVGAHEKMTDAIMLVSVNEKRNDIALISLPRDLFFRGRKINTLYVRHGPELFAREMAAMTGLPIEKYIIIDMYAFIDVINILGGIDVRLEEDLVDPTYRIRVAGGRWTTLFYPAGTHHLNGIEALRIARSRHFTSDFGRARRQQDMMLAIKNKFASLGIKDLGKAYDLMRTLIRYVDTNITPLEMVNYFLKYSDADFGSRTVLDTDNYLYHNYTNLKYLNLREDEVDEDFDKGAYILLPREDDWEAFRYYIRLILDGAAT